MSKKQFRIWVIDNGFIEVGYGQKINDPILGESLLITECHNIERYGTTKGLTELSISGPTQNTVLRKSRPTTIPISRVIKSIEIPNDLIQKFRC